MRKGRTPQLVIIGAADRRRNDPRGCGVTTVMSTSASPLTQVKCIHIPLVAPLAPPTVFDTSKQTFFNLRSAALLWFMHTLEVAPELNM